MTTPEPIPYPVPDDGQSQGPTTVPAGSTPSPDTSAAEILALADAAGA